jgi:DNA-binding HxlR family transcriptional regulator
VTVTEGTCSGLRTPSWRARSRRWGQLERDGLISRTHHAEMPPRVEYEITELGASLGPLFAHLATWADASLGRVEQARRAYDSA